MPIQAVIFDVGGVLIRPENHDKRREWEARLGVPQGGVARAVFGSEAAALAAVGQIPEEEVWKHAASILGLSAEQLVEFHHDFWVGEKLDAELVAFIQTLRPRYKTGILSNAWSGAREELQRKHKLCDAVDVPIFSAEVGCAKPDERIYRIALERLGVRPQAAIFVDDVLENVQAAQALGLHGVQFKDTFQTINEVKGYLDGHLAT